MARRAYGVPSLPIPYMAEGTRDGDAALIGALVAAHAAVWLAMPEHLMKALLLWPPHPTWYGPVTSLFVHWAGAHLALTMWAFWLFGGVVSGAVGRWFLPLYLACGVAGSLTHLFASAGAAVPAAGADGAVAGLAAAALVLDPRARFHTFTSVRLPGPDAHMTFSLSAALFAPLYLLALGAFAVALLPSFWPVAGGTVFGLLAGFALKFADSGAPAAAVTLSGGAGVNPARALGSASARAAVEEAIRDNREGEALQRFVDALRRDPGFELAPNAQLWAADKLARAGHPHMARAALKRFLARHGDDALAAHALLLEGFVHQSYLGDLDAAVTAYKRASLHPKAAAAVRADADARLSQADALLKRTFSQAPKADETYAVVMEGAADPTPEQTALIAEAAGDKPENVAARLDKAPGFVLRWMKPREAGELAARLEGAEFPVVVVPESALPRLGAARAVAAPAAGSNGIHLREPGGGEVVAPWSDCLLVAAGGVGMPKSTPKQHGLFELGDIVAWGGVGGRYGRRGRYGRYRPAFGALTPQESLYLDDGRPAVEYEAGVVHVPIIEVLTHGGTRRWRYTPCPDLNVDAAAVQSFFDVLQALVTAAPAIPVERGALAAFDRRIPEDCLHADAAAWDLYLTWQAQLAALKRPAGA
jgi:membrane associated rhomboid family serine protease